MSTSVFINYRRDDSGSEALLVRDATRREFGKDSAFMDSSSLQPGAIWPRTIRLGLRRAKTVLALIGPDWLRAGMDEWGQRRIDQKSDWVRCELVAALEGGKRVIPVLLRDGKMPPPNVLPKPLRFLPKLQAISIRRDYWDHDIQLLLAQLEEERAGHPKRHKGLQPYPTGFPSGPGRIPDDQLRRILKNDLKNWTICTTPLPEDSSTKREELFRELKFKSFSAAIRFMGQVSAGCDIAMHHPRWENIWKTLRVYLTTWDSAHIISDRDIQLARYFDAAYKTFPGAATAQKPKARMRR